MIPVESRRRILGLHGASPSATEELLAYNACEFKLDNLPSGYPLPDEAFVKTWASYVEGGVPGDVFSVLSASLVQLHFPITPGINADPEYRSATTQGVLSEKRRSEVLALEKPSELRLTLHQTPAGRIPILFTPHREDFVSLVRALSMRNEPGLVPASMGACLVSGYNNWHRVRIHRAECATRLGRELSEDEWTQEFRSLAQLKHLYQDKFILLSNGFYSGVPPEAMEMDASAWQALSLAIRREHECTHYFTRRVLSSARNNLLDELIADYCGMVAALGEYRPAWALHFLGLESYPVYRAGGRLENYRGREPLSNEAFGALQSLTTAAVSGLYSYWLRHRTRSVPEAIIGLSQMTLEELAAAA